MKSLVVSDSQGLNVLFLSPFFYPEKISTGRYNTALVEALKAEGCSVTVNCFHPFYPEWVPEPCSDQMPGVTIVRGGAHVSFPGNQVLRRLVLELAYAGFLLRQVAGRRRNWDLVIAVLPPTLFVPLVKRLVGAPMVGVVHDVQSVMASAGGGRFRRFLRKFIRWLDFASLRVLDRVVVLSGGMEALVHEQFGVAKENMRVSLPFVTLNAENARTDGLPPQLLEAGRRSLVYSGALGEKQQPERLLKLFQFVLEHSSDIEVFVFSSGPKADWMRARAVDTPDRRFRVFPLVAEEHLAGLLRVSGVQIVPQDFETSDGAFPSKVPNIIAAGTSLAAICPRDSELADVVLAYSKGCLLDSWDIEVIGPKLLNFIEHGGSCERSVQESDRSLARKFDRQALVSFILNRAG